MRERLNEEEIMEAITLSRFIWLRSNSLVFNKTIFAPSQLVAQAREMLLAFTIENVRTTEEGIPQPHSLNLWEKPPPGWMKANWDAAVDLNLKRMSTSVVVRVSL
jgi:hypothetical protein